MSLFAVACKTASHNETAVRHLVVLSVEFFLSDEVYGCVILIEVILHCLDIVLDLSEVSAFLRNYPALSQVLLTGSKLRLASASYSLHS